MPAEALVFVDDDAGYLDWVADNPRGYVLNVRVAFDPDYVVLHRATCGLIRSAKQEAGAFTERSYRKICASAEAGIARGARLAGRPDGTVSSRCGLCRP